MSKNKGFSDTSANRYSLALYELASESNLLLKIEAIRSHGKVWKYKGEAFVNDKKMADAIWSATIVDKK